MKRVSFVRHAKLESPYDNYDQASLDQLELLAMQTIMPSINSQTAHIDTATHRELQLHATTLILCATSVRARQTAALIQASLPRSVAVVTTPLLDEIVFSPKTLITQAEYDEQGMGIIREKLFASSVQGAPGVEPRGAIYSRIAALDQELQAQSDENIVCVTHGFYMRFLELYFSGSVRDAADVTEALLARQPNHPNLQGFRVQV